MQLKNIIKHLSNKLKFIFFLLLFSNILIGQNVNRVDTLIYDFNNDSKLDSVYFVHYNSAPYKGKLISIISDNNESKSKVTERNIFHIGIISSPLVLLEGKYIMYSYYYSNDEMEPDVDYYTYNDYCQCFYLEYSETKKGYFRFFWGPKTNLLSSDYKLEQVVSNVNQVKALNELKIIHEQLLNYENDSLVTKLIDNLNFIYFLKNIEINKKNVLFFNDIAYLVWKHAGYIKDKNKRKKLLLKSAQFADHVITACPSRIVAYLNLGDIYWDLGYLYDAIENYCEYLDLMKSSGKESKIPKRVFERIKE